jgi:hypothetical protein
LGVALARESTGVDIAARVIHSATEITMKFGLYGACCALALALVGIGCSDGTGDTTSSSSSSSSTSSTSSSGSTGGGGSAGEGGSAGAGGAGGAGGQLVLSDLEVKVEYAGVNTGTLSIAAFKQFPPMGPPLAFVQDKMPMFPVTKKLIGLEPGDYFITAILDIGNNNPQMPGPEDLQALTMPPVKVMGMNPPPVTLTLMDKP